MNTGGIQIQDGTVPAAPAGDGHQKNMDRLRKVAQNFESIFVSMMLRSMRSTIIKNDVLSTGRGGEVFQELMDTTFSEQAARSGHGLGIADMLIRQYTRMTERQTSEKTELSGGLHA